MVMTKIIILSISLLFLSCGKSIEKSKSYDGVENETIVDGTFAAILMPVNGNISSQINGDVQISHYGDEFWVKVRVKDAPVGVHKQFLHTGSTCPKIEHDLNQDGILDISESSFAIKSPILPLDNDLDSQSEGSEIFPKGDYRYIRSTSYYLMLSDLHLPDELHGDDLVKLNERDLPIENRVVVIYGNSRLGEVPIACGVLTRISERPLQEADALEDGSTRTNDTIHVPLTPREEPEIINEVQSKPSGWWQRLKEKWRKWRERRSGRN
jgi:hypothetical protein